MSTDPAKKLHSLLKKLRAEQGEPAPAAHEADCEGCPDTGDRRLSGRFDFPRSPSSAALRFRAPV